ncbi:MAG: carbohydrate kinase family protein [Chloroflexi bacterium]|nr:carbohydrate kinase family protein [Chloroflexota bacterium]
MIDFVAFGIVIDDVVQPDGQTFMGVLGGGGPQTAWGMAAALGSGARVGLAAGVGADFDAASLRPLRECGVNVEGVQAVWEKTPRAWQIMEYDGRRTHIWRAPPQASATLPVMYQGARGLHWGLHPENPDLNSAALWQARGQIISLEPFKPPDEPLDENTLRQWVTSCVIFSPNWREAARISGHDDEPGMLRRFRAAGCRILALRRGEQGADVWDAQSGVGWRVPALPTTVVDTVGAGNAFCGALLARLLTPDRGVDSFSAANMRAAAAQAVAAASYMVEQIGIPHGLPAPAEYQARVAYALERAVALRI